MRPNWNIAWRWLVVLACCFVAHTATACRYNVRDLGFIDMGGEAYRLCLLVTSNTTATIKTACESVASEVLQGANIVYEAVDVDHQPEHSAFKSWNKDKMSLPALVLVSPDGQSLPVKLPAAGTTFQHALIQTLSSLVHSPARSDILRLARSAFAVIVIMEGADAESNGFALREGANAVTQVAGQMHALPKKISRPPEILVLTKAMQAREPLLLWALGIREEDHHLTRAALVYGRARWIGPLMKGAEISARNLAGILNIIGADCECGLDLSWTQGTQLPIRWNDAWNTALAKDLDFDPENPNVKIEASRILANRGRASTQADAKSEYQEVLVGSKGFVPQASPQVAAANPLLPAPPLERPPVPSTKLQLPVQQTTRTVVLPRASITALAGLVVVVGLFIAWRGTRND